jgi:hypothetical protein
MWLVKIKYSLMVLRTETGRNRRYKKYEGTGKEIDLQSVGRNLIAFEEMLNAYEDIDSRTATHDVGH